MKKIVLKKIELKDWRSITATVKFNDGSTTIKGRNGCGKSSIFHAWTWLLTSCTDVQNGRNVDLFDNKVPLSHMTPEASVTACLEIDGVSYVLRRTARPCFVRDRESGEYVKQNTDKYKTFIDGLEVSATDFKGWIEANLCPVDMLAFCIDGCFFTTLASEDRRKARKILDSIVGEIVKDDFNGNYEELLASAGKYSIDDFLKICNGRIKDFIAEEKSNESKLSVIKDEIERCSNLHGDVKSRIEAAEATLSELKEKRKAIDSAAIILRDRREEYDRYFKNAVNGIDEEIKRLDSTIADIASMKLRIESNITSDSRILGNWVLSRERLQKSLDELKESNLCPVCKRELPTEIRTDRTLEEEKIKSQIKECDEKIAEYKKSIEENRAMLSTTNTETLNHERLNLVAKRTDLLDYHVPFESTDEFKALTEGANPEELDKDILIAEEAVRNLYRELGMFESGRSTDRIEKVENELKDISIKIARAYKDVHLCELWLNERAEIVSNRINSLLNEYHISMWSVLKNGEQVPDCVIMDKDGVTYATLNTAHRIKSCIEMQDMFCKHFGIEMPKFVDEASVFDDMNLPNGDGQYIYLLANNSEKMVVE